MRIARINSKIRGLQTGLRNKSKTWRMLSGASATLAIATIFMTVPAATQAAYAFPPPPNGDSICMYLNDNLCLTGEGVGNQVRTEMLGITAWNWVSATQNYKIKPTSNSSVCLQANGSGNGYHLEEQNCQTGNSAQEWNISSSNGIHHYIITNDEYGTDIGVFSDSTSKPVYVEADPNNFDYGWQG